jgi:hypothetical protein
LCRLLSSYIRILHSGEDTHRSRILHIFCWDNRIKKR